MTTPGQHGRHGYIAQGVACHLLSAPRRGAVPLYRYYRGGPNANHFYTTNAGEIGTTVVGRKEGMAIFMKEWLDTVTKRRFQAPPLYTDSMEEELTIFIPNALYQMKLQDTIIMEFNVLFTDKHLCLFLYFSEFKSVV